MGRKRKLLVLFKEKWTLVYFGFTRCPAECPVAMSLIKNLYSTLASKGFDLSDKQAFLVTIDPENDSANDVDKYAKAFSDDSVIRCAVNMEVTDLNHKISDNDEIAFFPPMTGG